MANSTYSEKLKNPAWQKKRLEILNRDNFTCVLCSDTDTELHVHHKQYKSGKQPWEYENDNFQTLCKHCHPLTEVYKKFQYTGVVAAKVYNSEFDLFHITSIFVSPKGLFVASIDTYYSNGKIENIDVLERDKVTELEALFKHAEKLIK